MKISIVLILLFRLFFIARADTGAATSDDPQFDLIIEKKLESKILSLTMTIKIKGNMVRIESAMPGEAVPSKILIYDLSGGKTTVLLPEEKIAMEMDLNGDKERTLAELQSAIVEGPKATGAQEKVGNWNADIYEWSSGDIKAKLWEAMDIPDGALIKKKLHLLSMVAPKTGAQVDRFEVPGVCVKSETTSQKTGTVTVTVIGIQKAALADSEFAIPADYRKEASPKESGKMHKN